jgi:hypothetical protein
MARRAQALLRRARRRARCLPPLLPQLRPVTGRPRLCSGVPQTSKSASKPAPGLRAHFRAWAFAGLRPGSRFGSGRSGKPDNLRCVALPRGPPVGL